MLEADPVRSFAVFAEHLNFTTAARALHISQPSLHAKIRKLGAVLGIDLYERHGRGLRLTPAGRRLAAFAEDSGRRTEDFLAALHATTAPVTIAAGRGSLRWVIGDGVRRLATSGRALRVITAGREGALAALSTGRADLAVVAFDPPPAPLRSRLLATYPQTLLVPHEHPLAGRPEARLRELDGLDLVVPPPERPHRRQLDRALLDAQVSWRVAAEVDGWDLQAHLSALGLGASVVNGCVGAPAGLTAVPVTDLPRVHYWAAWRGERDQLAVEALTHLAPPGDRPELVEISRFLAYVLRHEPGAIGIQLDGSGWVDLDTLLTALAEHDRPLDRATLHEVLTGMDRRRFEVADGRIRAAQGHTVPIDLQLPPVRPPAVLFHGTVERFLPRILRDGLQPRRRSHVHLSVDVATARQVGNRRGDPVVLRIDADGMHRAGHEFFRAANGVWLTAHVPPEFIGHPTEGAPA